MWACRGIAVGDDWSVANNKILNKAINNIFSKLFITIALIALGAWLVHFTWLERQVHYKKYNYTTEEARRLANFPRAQYDFGRRAWMALDTAAAAEYYRGRSPAMCCTSMPGSD